MSNIYTNTSLVTFPGNPGMMQMKTNKSSANPLAEIVPSIFMDDLAHVLALLRAIMKADIEGQEVPSLSHSIQLFTKVDIPVILMECWGGAQQKRYRTEEGKAMVTTLLSFSSTWG